MKRYWDTSALVAALHEPALRAMAEEEGQFTRVHTLTEAFSTLTGGRLGFRYSPDDAASLLRTLTAGFGFVELSDEETFMALDAAQRQGVRGGRVHDWLHARAATKAGVVELLTDNVSDFRGLESGWTIRKP